MKDVMDLIIGLMIPVIVFIYPKAALTYKIVKGMNGYLTLGEKLTCWIPVYNSVKIRKTINSKAPIYLSIAVITLILFIYTLLVRFVFYTDILQQIIATYSMWAVIIVNYLADIFIMFTSARLFDSKAGMYFCWFPPISAFFIYPRVIPYIKKYQDEIRGTFDGQGA